MRIVLCERANPGETMQFATLLVAEHRAKLGDAQRQIFVGTGLAGEHLTMMRAVHRLEHVFLVLFRCMNGLESVFAIMCIVAGSDIKTLTTYARRDDLLIVVRAQHAAQQLLQAKTKFGAFGQPNG